MQLLIFYIEIQVINQTYCYASTHTRSVAYLGSPIDRESVGHYSSKRFFAPSENKMRLLAWQSHRKKQILLKLKKKKEKKEKKNCKIRLRKDTQDKFNYMAYNDIQLVFTYSSIGTTNDFYVLTPCQIRSISCPWPCHDIMKMVVTFLQIS